MSVHEFVTACLVRLTEVGGRGRIGTGFFAAPGVILTCAHVVEPGKGEPLTQFDAETVSADRRWRLAPEQWRPGGRDDLAMLSLPDTNHPCVLFGAAANPTDPAWAQGYVAAATGVRLDPVIVEIEGERRERLPGPDGESYESTLIKLKAGQIVPGMSGAPLLNLRTGSICGVVALTRNEAQAAGGLAVPLRLILGHYPLIAVGSGTYHRQHRTWSMSNVILPSASLPTREREDALLALPRGPAVLLAVVPIDLIQRFCALTPTMSAATLNAANNLRIRIEPDIKPNLIALIGMPDPNFGVESFWMTVLAAAAAHGPRMVAALLYEAPPGLLDGMDDRISELISTLRSWPVN